MGFSAASARPGSPQHQRQTVPYEFSHYHDSSGDYSTNTNIEQVRATPSRPVLETYRIRLYRAVTSTVLVGQASRPCIGPAGQGARGSGPQMGHQTAAQTVFSRFQPEPIKGVVATVGHSTGGEAARAKESTEGSRYVEYLEAFCNRSLFVLNFSIFTGSGALETTNSPFTLFCACKPLLFGSSTIDPEMGGRIPDVGRRARTTSITSLSERQRRLQHMMLMLIGENSRPIRCTR